MTPSSSPETPGHDQGDSPELSRSNKTAQGMFEDFSRILPFLPMTCPSLDDPLVMPPIPTLTPSNSQNRSISCPLIFQIHDPDLVVFARGGKRNAEPGLLLLIPKQGPIREIPQVMGNPPVSTGVIDQIKGIDQNTLIYLVGGSILLIILLR